MSNDSPRPDPTKRAAEGVQEDPLWYKDAIVYQTRVGAYQDSDGDGTGDFRGLTERLGYIEDLGATAIWLLPFCPSPGRDDGYDIADYTDIHPAYGTLDDFKTFLREAHRRGLRVITELVINHTSDQHAWFQRARRAPPGSRWRNYYVWSDTPERYSEARIIFQDFETSNWTWDPVAKAYYWHRFYSHQPDLNFESREVRQAVLRFLDFWLKLGVDGLRLDAIPYLFEREGTSCENLPETHAFLKELRGHVDASYRDRMLLAEANQWPEDAVAYFGKGDECHMAFHFPVMPRLFMALHMEDRYPIIDILSQTPEIPETCQWAMFLRNHDELTLEMVTDEERDYMYGVYAQDSRARINLGIRRRLAPLLGNNRRRIELMNALLFSLPGTPILYYGDEIGMGDNIYLGDRNGVRTPMQWSPDRNAGFSGVNPQQLHLPVVVDPEYHYEALNVETQQRNPHSLLSWMKRLIGMRKRYQAFGRGSIEFLQPTNHKVLAFVRAHEHERILVVVNLSRFVEYVELDLKQYVGTQPVEIFGGRPFPPIGTLPYLLTLGPHSFYWFRLDAGEDGSGAGERGAEPELSRLRVQGAWHHLFQDPARDALEEALPAILRGRRWFGGKGRSIVSAKLTDAVRLGRSADAAVLALVAVDQGQRIETYAVPVTFVEGHRAEEIQRHHPGAALAGLEVEARDGLRSGLLVDALEHEGFCQELLDAIRRRRRFAGGEGEVSGVPTSRFKALRGGPEEPLPARLLRAEQSNSSVVYGERLVLKLFRRLGEGVNPDLELGRFLTEKSRFTHTPAVAGFLEYQRPRREAVTLGILQAFVPNEGDAWRFTLDQVESSLEYVLSRKAEPPPGLPDLLSLSEGAPPPLAGEIVGGYLETARLLGERTAEMHLALASDAEDPDFAPEPFTTLYQRAQYQSTRNGVQRTFALLRSRLTTLPEELAAEAEALAAREGELIEVCRALVGPALGGRRIRCHGDYHLGQVLYTGNDFEIIDFEGEPARSLGERRIKRSPLRDVAGMLRSFDYAAHFPLFTATPEAGLRPEDAPRLEPWARLWRQWTSGAFLGGYLPRLRESGLLPTDRRQLEVLLRIFLIDKCVYELGYEIDNRPSWIPIPLRGIHELLDRSDL